MPSKQGRLYRRHEIELFHRAEDPACERDLVATEPGRAGRLRRVLASWLAAASDPGWATQANLDPDELRDLERLGYVAGDRQAVADEWIDPDCACDTCVPFQ